MKQLSQADLKDKRVLLRAGFDVPVEDGKVVDTSRIDAIVPTMKYILDAGASLVIMAHQGRPGGKPDSAFSQKPLVPVLKERLGVDVQFVASCIGAEAQKAADVLGSGQVLLLENLRYEAGEKKNDPELAKELASLADVYVNDAFSNCHRAHASMVGVPKLLPSYMGLQLAKEVEHLSKVNADPARPLALIISGAKIETKIPVIEHFLSIGDDVLVGGCIANTFIAASGFDVGESRYDEQFVTKAQEIMLESEKSENAVVHVPSDAVVATDPSEQAEKVDLPVEDVGGDMKIFDIGKVTIERYIEVIEKSETIIWNGPLGLYELNRFSHATKRIAEAVAAASARGAVTIVGGGDTLDFHRRYDYSLDAYTFVSTGGGSMLELIAGQSLPALEALAS